MVVLTYDVGTADKEGAARLQRVAKLCERYGNRVQKSVFEMKLDAKKLDDIKLELERTIDHKTDSIRFYRLGNNFEDRISVMGVALPTMEESLILI